MLLLLGSHRGNRCYRLPIPSEEKEEAPVCPCARACGKNAQARARTGKEARPYSIEETSWQNAP